MTPRPAHLGLLGLLFVCAATDAARAQVSGQSGSGSGRPPVQTTPQGSVPQGAAPSPAAATGAVSGVVTDATTGAPLSGALVYLSNRGRSIAGTQGRQLTDTKGRFAFVNVPPGTTYTVTTSRSGYLDGGFLVNDAPGSSPANITVNDNQWVRDVKVAMWRPGAIEGVVVDESGEPVVGVLVRVLPRLRLQGRDELAAGPLALTDDRGAFRLGGLGPGKYLVEVPSVQASMPTSTPLTTGRGGAADAALELDAGTRLVLGRSPPPPPPLNGRSLAYPPLFYPGTPAVEQAGVIDLQYGEDRTGVDLHLEPVATFRVSGRVDGPPDAVSGLLLRLLPAGLESLGQGSEAATASVDADGRFTFLNVPAGSYTIDATHRMNELTTAPFSMGGPGSSAMFPMPPGRQGYGRSSRSLDGAPGVSLSTTSFGGQDAPYTARAAVVVAGADVASVTVTLRPGATLGGTFVIERDPNQPAPESPPRLSVLLDPAGGSPALGLPQSTRGPDAPPDEFVVPGLLPGEYWLRVLSPGWLVKSVRWKDKDYTATPFDAAATTDISGVVVTVTNAVPTLAGVVHDRDGAPSSGATVLVFPPDRAQWTNFGFVPARIKSTASSNDGAFSLATLPAGDYCVIAMTTPPAGWQDPDVFARLEPAATRVTLAWGQPTAVDLTIVTGR